jgi:hypothetical protein
MDSPSHWPYVHVCSKEFLEAGKKQLQGDTRREATSDEVSSLRKENARLKELVAATSWSRPTAAQGLT